MGAFCVALAGSASAQTVGPNVSKAAAEAALAALGLAATPNETLSSLSFLNASADGSDFRSTQFRGGDNPNFAQDFYVEGLLAYQVYNPTDLFPGIVPGGSLDVTWTALAGTIGVGYEIPVGLGWTFRPIGHASLGYVSTDAFLDRIPIVPIATQTAAAVESDLLAGGIGGSVGLWKDVAVGSWDVEYRFRHTYMAFFPIDEPGVDGARANAHQSTFFSRHRHDLPGFDIAGAPVKAVLDAGVVLYHGDGARVLGASWLGMLGAGIELDTEAVGLPVIHKGRLMLNGFLGDGFSGFSIGLGLGF